LQNQSRLRVERGERLVHQQDLRRVDEDARQGCRLSHAGRQLVRVTRGRGFQADGAKHGLHGSVDLRPRDTPLPGTVFDVAPKVQPGKQGVFLEHHRAVRPRPFDRLAVDQDLPGAFAFEAGEDVEQRSLPAAARTDDRDEFAVPDIQRNVLAGDNRLATVDVTEDFRQAPAFDQRTIAHPVAHRPINPFCHRSDIPANCTRSQSETRPRRPTLMIASTIRSSLFTW
jgi:hypothetical protein